MHSLSASGSSYGFVYLVSDIFVGVFGKNPRRLFLEGFTQTRAYLFAKYAKISRNT
jgi:hypothetical protein